MVDVRQRQYAIGLSKDPSSVLFSQYYSTCVGFAGVDRKNGVAFLCHFDTPCTVGAFDDLIVELKKHAPDLGQFEIYTAASIWPGWWIILIGVLSFLSISDWFAWAAVLISGIFLSATRLFLIHKLRKTKIFKGKPKNLGYYYPFFRHEIKVNADIEGAPHAKRYFKKRNEQPFKPIQKWYKKAQKADGSA